jgi:hypothetical protein
MRSSSFARRGLGLVAGVAGLALGACSKTPTYVTDATGGSGGASHTASAGSPASSSGSGGMAPEPCANPADCGMVTTACAQPTCVGGHCGTQYQPMGTPTAAQVSSDCKQNVCDGQGHVIAVADPGDLPYEHNTCTTDSCTGSTPVHTPAPANTTCGAGMSKCDDLGQCVGCNSDAQCGDHGPCYVWTCVDMTCTPSFVPAGTGDPGGDAPGDCQRYACDGMGGVAPIADPTDHPAAPSACLLGACAGGAPATTPAPAGTPCLGGTCDGAGHCGACTTSADCGPAGPCATPVCVAGHCSATFAAPGTLTPTQILGDCHDQVCNGAGGVTSTVRDSDAPAAPDACTVASCSMGMVVHTPVDVTNSGNPCIADGCDPVTGVFHTPLGDGTSCGGCSSCQATVCTDPCPSQGLTCMGTSCG